ncbi:hypothetical protein QE152_g13370 [Popillia japonica]|uniref:Uncharacterized protein n=1 Tax=Popillia japonica TaxID=7064 RepID=A0AAW1LE29_POPJA
MSAPMSRISGTVPGRKNVGSLGGCTETGLETTKLCSRLPNSFETRHPHKRCLALRSPATRAGVSEPKGWRRRSYVAAYQTRSRPGTPTSDAWH